MHIVIIGGGAIGSYITAKFANNTSHQITLVARGSYNAIKAGRIIVDENNSTYTASRFKVTNDINLISAADIIVIAVRTSQNTQFSSDLYKICHDKTLIITLQNGLNFEHIIANTLPQQQLYSGTCWIKVTTISLSHVRHDFGTNIKLGRYIINATNVLPTSADQIVSSLFKEAGLNVDLITNIKSVQLTKLALNIPFFLLAVVKHKSFSEILYDSVLDKQRKDLEKEIVSAAILIKSPVDTNFIEQITAQLRKIPLAVPLGTRQEFANKMRLELPSNLDPLINLMDLNRINLPLLRELYNSR